MSVPRIVLEAVERMGRLRKHLRLDLVCDEHLLALRRERFWASPDSVRLPFWADTRVPKGEVLRVPRQERIAQLLSVQNRTSES